MKWKKCCFNLNDLNFDDCMWFSKASKEEKCVMRGREISIISLLQFALKVGRQHTRKRRERFARTISLLFLCDGDFNLLNKLNQQTKICRTFFCYLVCKINKHVGMRGLRHLFKIVLKLIKNGPMLKTFFAASASFFCIARCWLRIYGECM